MSGTVTISARIPEAEKREAATVLAAMGMTVTDAARLLIARIAEMGSMPFDPFASELAVAFEANGTE